MCLKQCLSVTLCTRSDDLVNLFPLNIVTIFCFAVDSENVVHVGRYKKSHVGRRKKSCHGPEVLKLNVFLNNIKRLFKRTRIEAYNLTTFSLSCATQ